MLLLFKKNNSLKERAVRQKWNTVTPLSEIKMWCCWGDVCTQLASRGGVHRRDTPTGVAEVEGDLGRLPSPPESQLSSPVM